ncbi:carboxypeptidase-like regulatory domain-containing protein [uncultured Paludibaculum sp.]|uniref:carboxypeptidase-like regulatory domain-containing protein n=1 Tax=uncultured Paludibaculum sp. TaxID=1765020 RepID=UPI002AAAC99A|nr:carboxypeptidase-like regulatory domain-containing protein [uncultured Paludibaculum sp.]
MVRYKLAVVLLILGTGRAFGQPERSSSIAGRVVNSVTGAPLHRATVEITREGRDDVRGQAGTEGDGQFLLRALPAGRYRISVTRPGYAPMNYGARRPNAPGQVITLGANENMSGLLIRMSAFGAISGTVAGLLADSMNAQVVALPVGRAGGTGGTVSIRGGSVDRRGEYRIYGLLPGRYLLQLNYTARPPQELFPSGANIDLNQRLSTYYPSTLNRQEARVVEISSGQEATGFDIVVQQPAQAVLCVRVLWPKDVAIPKPEPGTIPTLLSLATRHAGKLQDSYVSGQPIMAGDASAQYQALVPGRYTVGGTVQLRGQCYSTRAEVNATQGTSALELPLQPCIDFRGRVRITGASALPAGLTVSLGSPESLPVTLDRPSVQPDGSFVIHAVPAALWTLSLNPMPSGSYLKSITLGTLDVLNRPIPITPETATPIEIVIGARGAEAQGRVEKGFATTILAAPEGEAASLASRYSTTGVDENGNFHLRGLYPGAYRLYAFEDLEPEAWLDPNFLAGYRESGTSVQLQEGPSPELRLQAIPGARRAPQAGGR